MPRAVGRLSMQAGSEGEIRGRVVDSLSDPVSGARITLYRSGDAGRQEAAKLVVVSTVSDAEGFFRMRGLESGGYLVRARAKGYAVGQRGFHLSLVQRKLFGMRIRLKAAHALEGVVVDALGQPVACAWVVADSLLTIPPPEVRSDAKGRYRLDALPRGKVWVVAWAEGHALGLADGFVGRTESIRVELPETGRFKMSFSLAEPKEKGVTKPADVSISVFRVVANVGVSVPSPIQFRRLTTEGEVDIVGLRAGN